MDSSTHISSLDFYAEHGFQDPKVAKMKETQDAGKHGYFGIHWLCAKRTAKDLDDEKGRPPVVIYPEQSYYDPKCEKPQTGITFKRAIGATFLLIGFLLSVSLGYILWFTTIYDSLILNILKLKSDGLVYDIWKHPPVKNLIYVYAFNYTNPKEALAGKELPKVVEVGPYVYTEGIEKYDIMFENEDRVSFREKHHHEFIPELSKGSLNDTLIVPNMPLLAAIHIVKNHNILTRTALSLLLGTLRAEPFQKVNARNFIWGYDDNFSILTRRLSHLLNRPMPPAFGALSMRISNKDRMTVSTGMSSLDTLNDLLAYNEKKDIGVWGLPECNNFAGSDGTLFPPTKIQRKDPIYIYLKDFCTRVELSYKEEVVTEHGYPAHRYILPDRNFFYDQRYPRNAMCFCDNKTNTCPIEGTFSTAPCSFGAPALLSFPHFLYGDERLVKGVDGLSPNPKHHSAHADFHKIFGIPLSSRSRFQVNIQVSHADRINQVKGIKDGTVLPVCWLEMRIGEIKGVVDSLLFHGTYTAQYMKVFLIICSSIAAIVSLLYFWLSIVRVS